MGIAYQSVIPAHARDVGKALVRAYGQPQRSMSNYRCNFDLKATVGICALLSLCSCALAHYAALPLTVPDLTTRITCPYGVGETPCR
jgi:hypothetical protein